jgi:hypothetical protein
LSTFRRPKQDKRKRWPAPTVDRSPNTDRSKWS